MHPDLELIGGSFPTFPEDVRSPDEVKVLRKALWAIRDDSEIVANHPMPMIEALANADWDLLMERLTPS